MSNFEVLAFSQNSHQIIKNSSEPLSLYLHSHHPGHRLALDCYICVLILLLAFTLAPLGSSQLSSQRFPLITSLFKILGELLVSLAGKVTDCTMNKDTIHNASNPFAILHCSCSSRSSGLFFVPLTQPVSPVL